ncbi:hypothetical protein [Glycomyces buryatensis]|uniref:Septum formation initiator family protein n=1 Tax=Glycomyces buryatensis TaxID=2570927 RepID=A0A4S8QBQ2_9ACTN|nr:hypothetical protein [Glycomyces buryatensis]THV38479.1 hypothetical protein FAB82_18710 [Glycomyces buryatensis]
MSNAPYRRPQADAEEIIKAARRRARAASSRRRTLVGEAAEAPVVDGSLAVQPETVPVETPVEAPLHERPTEVITPAPEPATRTRVAPSPRTEAAPEPVEVPRPAFVGGIIALVVAGIVGLLLLNTVINEDAYHLQDLRSQAQDLDQSEQELDSELAELRSPNNLEVRASNFGMVRPDKVTFLYLPDGETVEVPWSEE